jgi:hypothetical protein
MYFPMNSKTESEALSIQLFFAPCAFCGPRSKLNLPRLEAWGISVIVINVAFNEYLGIWKPVMAIELTLPCAARHLSYNVFPSPGIKEAGIIFADA